MPAHIAANLRSHFEHLPPRAAKYRTREGALFLRRIKLACEQYGARQVGEAIGLSTATVYQIRHRQLPQKIYEFPTDEQMSEVRQAWAEVQARKAAHRQVRRTTDEFARMKEVLENLRHLIHTDDVMIAVALGVEPAQLRFFEDQQHPLRRTPN